MRKCRCGAKPELREEHWKLRDKVISGYYAFCPACGLKTKITYTAAEARKLWGNDLVSKQ